MKSVLYHTYAGNIDEFKERIKYENSKMIEETCRRTKESWIHRTEICFDKRGHFEQLR